MSFMIAFIIARGFGRLEMVFWFVRITLLDCIRLFCTIYLFFDACKEYECFDTSHFSAFQCVVLCIIHGCSSDKFELCQCSCRYFEEFGVAMLLRSLKICCLCRCALWIPLLILSQIHASNLFFLHNPSTYCPPVILFISRV